MQQSNLTMPDIPKKDNSTSTIRKISFGPRAWLGAKESSKYIESKKSNSISNSSHDDLN